MAADTSRREFLRRLGLAGAAVSVARIGEGCLPFGTSPPNIVLIFMDDLGFGDLGVYGATGYTTPHLDRLAHSMPHVPLGISEKFRGHSEQGMFGDVMEEIDWSVGEVLSALDRIGLAEKTLVIFTSDNGPWLNFGNHAGSTGGLREGKGTAFEGGPRVPAIMRWPGRIEAGAIASRMASTLDVLPTLAAVAGAPLPEEPIDGVNLLPLLEGDPTANPRDRFYFYYGGELRGVREGRMSPRPIRRSLSGWRLWPKRPGRASGIAFRVGGGQRFVHRGGGDSLGRRGSLIWRWDLTSPWLVHPAPSIPAGGRPPSQMAFWARKTTMTGVG